MALLFHYSQREERENGNKGEGKKRERGKEGMKEGEEMPKVLLDEKNEGEKRKNFG